ncbi:MAG: hypothetical protein NTZ65_00045 [Candidatus Berkelbacteria bacterium]|nr:hypothetical protein [Candidatus Berkelbacteria bacterium]
MEIGIDLDDRVWARIGRRGRGVRYDTTRRDITRLILSIKVDDLM